VDNSNKKKLSRWISVLYKRQNNTKLIKGESTNEKTN
jgi:hypothetical protein